EAIEHVDDDTRLRRWSFDCDRFATEHECAIARCLSKRFACQWAEIFRETLRIGDVDLANDVSLRFALCMKNLDQAGSQGDARDYGKRNDPYRPHMPASLEMRSSSVEMWWNKPRLPC